MQKLIILRGNSASGKSTVAKALRKKIGYETMLIQQDVVRRDILRVQDLPGNPSIELIYDLAMYGKKIGYDVIIDGIMHADKCDAILRRIIADFKGEAHVYYFDIPFEETLRRHETKMKEKEEYGEDEMRLWWREKDYVGLPNETTLHKDMEIEEVVEQIISDAGVARSVY